jgi:exonuclease III
MTLKIATWNLCLGLFHKKDYVRKQLYENNIDLLTLQETELSPELQLENLQIKGYSIEVENNNKKKKSGNLHKEFNFIQEARGS